MLAGLSASGAHGTLVQVVDPAEESFPYSGRVEFVELRCQYLQLTPLVGQCEGAEKGLHEGDNLATA